MSPSQRAVNKKVFSVSFEKELIEAIEAECKRLGINRNAFIKLATREKLKKEQLNQQNITDGK
jgi:metal-responsive CopG/Arc/MetJ family transcriptional regulator